MGTSSWSVGAYCDVCKVNYELYMYMAHSLCSLILSVQCYVSLDMNVYQGYLISDSSDMPLF